MEEVDTKCATDGEELLGVDGRFVEELLEGSRGNANLLS